MRITFTSVVLLKGTAFFFFPFSFFVKKGQRMVYAWTLIYLKLPFVEVRHTSDVLCADNTATTQKWYKSMYLTCSSAGQFWHVSVMGTGRYVSSRAQRKATELGYSNGQADAGFCAPAPLLCQTPVNRKRIEREQFTAITRVPFNCSCKFAILREQWESSS